MKETIYLFYRKMKAMRDRICFFICRLFPIKKNRISVCTFEGKGGFGCNPKYIVEELHRRNPSYEFIWFVNDMKKSFPEYVRKVPNIFWSRAYWLSTSAVWIDNYRKPYGTFKRKGQYYLNTNHYTVGMKNTGLCRGTEFSKMAYLVSKNDSEMIDDLIIDSKWCEDSFGDALVYSGRYLKIGTPRCDVFFRDRRIYHKIFCERHGLPENVKVIMYAPTFREGAKNGKRIVFLGNWSVDFKRLIMSMEKRFGGKWYLCTRVHPQLAKKFQEYRNEEIQDRLIDESQADDMYEILAGMDAYITDYSSAMFDAGFAEIPVFLYADDIQTYASDRGGLMWNLASDPLDHVMNNKEITPEIDAMLPFSVAQNNEELVGNIENFNEEIYKEKIKQLKDAIGLIFDGKASERVADRIEDICSYSLNGCKKF